MVHPAGFEPTTLRFAAWYSSNWAMGAFSGCILYKKIKIAKKIKIFNITLKL